MTLTAVSKRKPAPDDTEERRLRVGELGQFLGFDLRIAQEASFRAFSRASGVPQLKPRRFAAMMVIRDNPGISPIELSRLIARDKSSVTPLIQDLERRGLVNRRPSKSDRRSLTLTLTRHGARALEEMLTHAREHERRLDAIAGPNRAELVRILRKIANSLD